MVARRISQTATPRAGCDQLHRVATQSIARTRRSVTTSLRAADSEARPLRTLQSTAAARRRATSRQRRARSRASPSITTLSNSGAGGGGTGGSGFYSGSAGGAGISNSGTIAALAKRGTVEGGASGASRHNSGAAGDAVYSAAAHAPIGATANTGRIVGNVVVDNQASVSVTGGTGKTFGSWTGAPKQRISRRPSRLSPQVETGPSKMERERR
jgi:hypothetical protein